MKKTLITIILCTFTLTLVACKDDEINKKNSTKNNELVCENKNVQKEPDEVQTVEEEVVDGQSPQKDPVERAKEIIIEKTDIDLNKQLLEYVEKYPEAAKILIRDYGNDYYIFFIQYVIEDGSYITSEKCYAVKKGTEDVYVITPVGIYTYDEFNN